jgi:hypothetical protein|tara:strand:- start:18714 stop:18917 length:204 start_codon:yes stop_codon:yes gene_type:complete
VVGNSEVISELWRLSDTFELIEKTEESLHESAYKSFQVGQITVGFLFTTFIYFSQPFFACYLGIIFF